MAVLGDKKIIGAPFGNEARFVAITYDFSVDGGAIADYDVIEADGSILVELVNIDVETACTSGGAAVLDLGKGAGGAEFKSDEALGDISLDAQLPADTVGTFIELADGEKIVMGVEAAAYTAGKFHMMYRIYRRPKQ